jgi:hypothetical protein
VEQKCSMGGAEMLQPIVDKEKEEEALAYSSSFSNNEKLKIKSFSVLSTKKIQKILNK